MRIPSTQALRALESFARHGSVWRAAEELNLTSSAVSHQLRLLERELGFTLFKRVGKGVALTLQGQRYTVDVRKALAMIRDAAFQHGDHGVRGALTISCAPSFASTVLCPRILEFTQMYPGVMVTIVTSPRPGDPGNPCADAFIVFGEGAWPGHSKTFLSECHFLPTCSPALLNRVGGFAAPADLLRMPLLHLTNYDDWRRWAVAQNIDGSEVERGIIFSDMNLVLAAAISGQGIAIGDDITCAKAFDAGQLVRPFEQSIRSTKSYYLVVGPDRAEAPAVRAFSDWLRAGLPPATGRRG